MNYRRLIRSPHPRRVAASTVTLGRKGNDSTEPSEVTRRRIDHQRHSQGAQTCSSTRCAVCTINFPDGANALFRLDLTCNDPPPYAFEIRECNRAFANAGERPMSSRHSV